MTTYDKQPTYRNEFGDRIDSEDDFKEPWRLCYTAIHGETKERFTTVSLPRAKRFINGKRGKICKWNVVYE